MEIDSACHQPETPACAVQKSRPVPKPDILARLQADFGDFVVTDECIEKLMHDAGESYIERVS